MSEHALSLRDALVMHKQASVEKSVRAVLLKAAANYVIALNTPDVKFRKAASADLAAAVVRHTMVKGAGIAGRAIMGIGRGLTGAGRKLTSGGRLSSALSRAGAATQHAGAKFTAGGAARAVGKAAAKGAKAVGRGAKAVGKGIASRPVAAGVGAGAGAATGGLAAMLAGGDASKKDEAE